MAIKNIILVSISVGLLGGSAYLLYSNFIAPSFDASVQPIQTVSAVSLSIKKIFPYGDNLDFGPVRSFNSNGKIFNYPQVSDSEIGTTGKDLFNVSTQ